MMGAIYDENASMANRECPMLKTRWSGTNENAQGLTEVSNLRIEEAIFF
jgi:hypothetical protein